MAFVQACSSWVTVVAARAVRQRLGRLRAHGGPLSVVCLSAQRFTARACAQSEERGAKLRRCCTRADMDAPSSQDVPRCKWVTDDPLYIAYHDTEWGVPVHDDTRLFEMLTLEGAQAGLNWLTVLKRRESYRVAFDGFDARIIATYGAEKEEALLQDPGIIRHKLKVKSTIGNAQAFLRVQAEHGSFDSFIWSFAPKNDRAAKAEGDTLSKKRKSSKPSAADAPRNDQLVVDARPVFLDMTETPESRQMSKALKEKGFRFVGPTICHAFMQAVGMVNDHAPGCWLYAAGARASAPASAATKRARRNASTK
ncbi:DNA-3-methyladenine glycosylase 1 [Porphyridium purpureum]|uniref:DNA-3-methyladenine glycosylase 1 n=1 Tax=Porphyridium purpureum TaxID=35688 RepID=A0A5J4YHS2_PORPP|nr:DNA-3-methyladenine glycosylase 1 [Porphyridium purpureum]|eukprot:POR7960..scf289_17